MWYKFTTLYLMTYQYLFFPCGKDDTGTDVQGMFVCKGDNDNELLQQTVAAQFSTAVQKKTQL